MIECRLELSQHQMLNDSINIEHEIYNSFIYQFKAFLELDSIENIFDKLLFIIRMRTNKHIDNTTGKTVFQVTLSEKEVVNLVGREKLSENAIKRLYRIPPVDSIEL